MVFKDIKGEWGKLRKLGKPTELGEIGFWVRTSDACFVLGLRVWGPDFRVHVSGEGLGFRVCGLRFMSQGLRFI